MLQKSSKNLLKTTFWRAFSLTAFLLVVSQKIDQLRKKTPRRVEITTRPPEPLYWASEVKSSPKVNFKYQEIYPAPFQSVSFANLDFSNLSFNQASALEFDDNRELYIPPNWTLIKDGNNSTSGLDKRHFGCANGIIGMN